MEPRTLVRVFLVVGGVAYAAGGVLTESPVNVGFGLLAAALGGFGIWWDRREAGDQA